MSAAFHQRAKSIFFEVCDAPLEDRERLLGQLCGDDGNLRGAVEALLRTDPGEEDDTVFSPRPESALLAAMVDDEPPSEPVGEIAGCTIIRKVGEGGMGAVYECEQQTPRRRVAIKLMHRGRGGQGLQRRFRQEAEALGRLRHPNIAQVFEAGTTVVNYSSGHSERCSFLMLELVEGFSLTAFAKEHSLSVQARVQLVIGVCDGVSHAHAKGVVHRDLKPGNILVEAQPTPMARVLDFGIARITSPDNPTATMMTTPGQILGTLAYMSPEQMVGDARLVDTRSDVYAIGVILYELLAERLPLDLERVSIAEAARISHDVEPASLASVAPRCRGDLDTIVAKAMRKAPEERYQSVAELGADLRRHLDNQPIAARAATRAYVLRKFIGRNPALAGVTAAAIVAVLAGGIASTAGWLTVRRTNQQLRESNLAANTQLRRSEQVVQFMRDMLLSVRPMVAGKRDTTLMTEVLERTVHQIDGGGLDGQPGVEAEMRTTLAETYSALGDNKQALAQIELAMRNVGGESLSAQAVSTHVRRTYANILIDWGRYEDAGRELTALLALRRRANEPESKVDAEILSAQAAVAARLGRAEDSLNLQRQALAIRRRVLGDRHPDIAASTGNIAGSLQNLGRLDEALPMLRECLSIYEAMDPPALMHITVVRNNLASLLNDMGRAAEAEEVIRRGLEVATSIYKPDHQQLGLMRYNLALSLRALNRHEEAAAELAGAANVLRSAFGSGHELATASRVDLGIELTLLRRFSEAQTELLAAQRELHPKGADSQETARKGTQALASLYEAWEAAEPGNGHEAQARAWRSDPGQSH